MYILAQVYVLPLLNIPAQQYLMSLLYIFAQQCQQPPLDVFAQQYIMPLQHILAQQYLLLLLMNTLKSAATIFLENLELLVFIKVFMRYSMLLECSSKMNYLY